VVGTQKFQIDPAAFRSSANVTRGVADKLHGIWTGLASGLDGLGSPWGTDKIGDQFANGTGNNGYLSTVSGMRDGITGGKGFCASIDNLADGQESTADYIEKQIEPDNKAAYRSAGQ
jgi:hypothetical protein